MKLLVNSYGKETEKVCFRKIIDSKVKVINVFLFNLQLIIK